MKVGVVSHYFPTIGVAIADLTQSLYIGERIRFSGSSNFSQTVSSLQIEHVQVESAQPGQSIGLKVTKPVLAGDEVIVERI